ncbi:MAG: hypothetical protein JWP97_745 [Labilithrix sp.]|nr:hypothetical protein [Labilithrix sp.]
MGASRLLVPALACVALLSGCRKRSGPPDGAELFASTCARCHGERGEGGSPLLGGGTAPRNFHDHAFQTQRTDEQLADVIVHGKGSGMPAFGSFYSEAERKALVQHVRSFDPR